MRAILLRRTGAPSVLEYCEVPTPRPGPGEVLVKADTIGISMPETLVRKGTYAWMPPLPAILGIEMSGTITETGSGVSESGSRRERSSSAPATSRCAPAVSPSTSPSRRRRRTRCRKVVDLEAAACLSNYQVAYHLLHTASRGVDARTVLVHTAAGGVGSAAVQLAVIAGMRVIGSAGTEAKRQAVLGLGAGAGVQPPYRRCCRAGARGHVRRGRSRPDPRPDRRQGLCPQFRDARAARPRNLLWPPRRPARPGLCAGNARASRGQPGGPLVHNPQFRSPA